jgi:hypothetical protein
MVSNWQDLFHVVIALVMKVMFHMLGSLPLAHPESGPFGIVVVEPNHAGILC